MPKQQISEARAVILEGTGLKRIIRVITPGMGSSGYYPTETLKEAVTEGVFGAGMHLYVDHPSLSENTERPERSVRDLGAVATGPAVWNEAEQAVDQPIKIFEHYSWLGDPDVAPAIGMSIRASADVNEAEIDGKRVPVIEKLVEAFSVDFVTKAGRGGKVLEAMESARPHVQEALINEVRDRLDLAVREKYGTEGSYAWVRDFDPDQRHVYWSGSTSGREGTYRESYVMNQDDLGVSLAGDAIEVRLVQSFVPVEKAATEAKESKVPKIEIEESEVSTLREAAARVEAAEAENKRLQSEAKELREAEAKRVLTESASNRFDTKIGTTLDHLPASVKERAKREASREVPVTTEGVLDESAYDAVIDKAVEAEKSYLATVLGNGVRGHGVSESTFGDHSGSAYELAEAARQAVPFSGRN